MDGLVALAGTLGAGVVFRPLDSSISGVVVKEDDADPIIYINSNEPEARQRFTLAHEIGHLVERKNLAD
ncbi:ImmA/IrrE family metallo-endopeptidase [Corynebacterium mayonis]|uniref:ImmA/IrrE family metallo-endopeptidase n=1 Tax=Corynebacterium mayonis TaxID=3062461 RepID=UPI003CC7EEFA